MTELILDHRSQEEKENFRQKYVLEMSEEARKEQESSEKVFWNPIYDFEETWRLWESGLNKDKINRYIIAHFPRNDCEFDFVYVINIVELATVIKKHYDIFQEYLGFDFDPLEAVFDIQNNDSPFWDKILNSKPTTPEKVCLMGILFGYGLENSYPFSLVFNKERVGPSKKFTSYFLKQLAENMETKGVRKFSSREFSIPGFRVFSTCSPTKLKYEEEKIMITNYFKGKDLEQATLELLYK